MVTIAQDKIEHWAFGFVLTLFALIWCPLAWLGLIFAFGKEAYDYKYGTGWSNTDLFATVAGSGVAVLFLSLIKG